MLISPWGSSDHFPKGLGVTKLQFFILSRDRAELLDQTLASVVPNLTADVQLIVSDNSETDAVSKLLATKYPQLDCVRRNPTLPALAHFEAVIEECSSEYVVIFHDDDLLLPNYLPRLLSALKADPSLSAVACNAYVMKEQEKTNQAFMAKFSEAVCIQSASELLDYYFSIGRARAAPFPSYMYRASSLKGCALRREQGGKYSDVSFLLEVLWKGNILWLPEPLMFYRIHGANDSATEKVGQRMSLLRYVYRHQYLSRKSRVVQDYRFKYWLSWFRSSIAGKSPWRFRVVRSFLVRYGAHLALTRFDFWTRFFGRLK